MKTFDVVTLGELLIDMFPDRIGPRIGEVEKFIPKPGGAPANVAVAASRLEMKTAFIGKVGEDLFGSYLKRVLDQERVETRGIRFDPRTRTTLVIIAMPDENSAEFVFYRNPGADQHLTDDDLDLDLLSSTRMLHFGSVSLSDEPARSATFAAARFARDAGARISFDVNYRPSLWQDTEQALRQIKAMIKEVDLVKANEVEAALLTGEEHLDSGDPSGLERAARELLQQGPELVVLTLGAQGSYYQTRQAGAFVPAFPVDTIDAVGCGDAFVAGMLAKLARIDRWQEELDPNNLAEILTYANAVGALTSLKRGAIPAMPTLDQVEYFLSEQE